MNGDIKTEVEQCLKAFSEQKGCIIDELNVQEDHVHLVLFVPPKVSISEIVGILKGRTAIRLFNKYKRLKNRPYWGNHFWSKGYCVDAVGLDAEMIKRYVRYQEKKDKRDEEK